MSVSHDSRHYYLRCRHCALDQTRQVIVSSVNNTTKPVFLLSFLKRIPWRKLRTRLILAVLAVGFVILVPSNTPGGNDLNTKVLGQARDVLFNYLAWEADALARKITQTQAGVAPYLTEAERSKYVHDYLQTVLQFQSLEGQITSLYSNPKVADPATASAKLIQQRDQTKQKMDEQQPLAEAIVETQVASVLRDEGFATLGEIIPPVSAHITDLPMVLIISPRNVIRFEIGINVAYMDGQQRTDLENQIDQALGVSSLIEPLGGLALYPTMVMRTWNAYNLFNVVSHEWSHNYLYFFPLGLNYLVSGETRIINETTATLLGHEVSRKVLERFYKDYPDLLSQIPAPALPNPVSTAIKPTITPLPRDPDAPPPFSFDAELNKTRITVDFYLHYGLVDLAESYMESRRQVFADHGYNLRKLNQAFFAFYGGYQSAGGGAGGSDPIGPAVSELRERSPSLKVWLEIMRSITTRDELLAARDKLRTMPNGSR